MSGYVCVLYVSEAACQARLSRLRYVARSAQPVTTSVHEFVDKPYNRSSFFLLSKSRRSLQQVALAVCGEAFKSIDFATAGRRGSHPTLGVVDHVCFSPVPAADATYDTLLRRTCDLGIAFGEALHRQERIDAYFYGAAQPRPEQSLRVIRKALGYFSAHTHGQQQQPGPDSLTTTVSVPVLSPDLAGDPGMRHRKGVTCIGVVPLVTNLNIRLTSVSSQAKTLARQLTSRLRVPHAVEALTLQWHDQLEIACNLRSHRAEHSSVAVLRQAHSVATELGLEIEQSYTTGPTEHELSLMLTSIPSADQDQ
jgi:glutamate formiminotransferase